MQAKIRTQPYEYFDPIFDGAFEAPIDTEYNLPDYCPDVQKILKCQAVPEISSYVISDDTLTCDGICDIRVLYLDAKGDCVRCCEFTKEFTASVKVKSTEEKAVARLKASIEHMTCRAVSARRIDIHISISVKALAVVQKQELITCGIDDDSIEKLCTCHNVSQAVNALSHRFTIEDDILLKNGKPPIETILRKNISCRVTDCRVSDGKLTVNGSVEISFLYVSSVDGVTLEKMNSSVDFTQIIDCGGADEDCTYDVKAIVGESTLQTKEDDMGEYTTVSVVAAVFISAYLYKPCEVEVIDDAYALHAPLDLKYTQSSFLQVHGTHREVLKKKCSLSVPDEEIEKILDVWCDRDNVQSTCDKGKLNFRVRYTVCMLYINSLGRIAYTEKEFDYNAACDTNNADTRKTDTSYRTEIWEYRITDKNTVEISVETTTTTFLYNKVSVKYLLSANVDEDAAADDIQPRLLVYYASSGEKLWNIAKSHKASLTDIRTQNDIFDETVRDDRPLIIINR